MTREYEYEITRHDTDKLLGRVWWNGKKIEADNPIIMSMIRHAVVSTKTIDDGKEFMEMLPQLFKSGYVSAKRIK